MLIEKQIRILIKENKTKLIENEYRGKIVIFRSIKDIFNVKRKLHRAFWRALL